VPDRYDDGGFSGSTLERPALTRLFDIAREMEAHSLSKNLQSFDALGVEVKSFLGILLDFSSLPREKIAAAVHSKAIKSAKSPEASSTGPGPLFDGEGPASSRGS
jgi:hypothetical protein